MITYDDALKQSKEYFGNEELPAKIFIDKYAIKDSEGNLLEATPDDMHERVAAELARIEATKFKNPLSKEKILSYVGNFKKVMLQGSPLYGIGNKEQFITLSNCYVLEPPLDSYGGIHHTDEQLTQISKRRGGVGIDLDNLRPNRATTRNSSRTSSGPISFAKRYSHSINEVGQDGRRGALMLTISVHHPDVVDFARAKLEKGQIEGANMSIKLSDEFLRAVELNTEYQQRWPVNAENPKVSKLVKAREVWREIIKCAWTRAEPGLLFWDMILRESPADCYEMFRTICTNPCSELPLSLLDSCRLLAMNLFYYVKNAFTKDAYFDYHEFYHDAQISQRLMDDLVDLELEAIARIIAKIEADPEPMYIKRRELELWKKIHETCAVGRRTGLGITALGDTIAALGIGYGTEESIHVTEQIYKTLKFGAYRSSVDMAKELGPFGCWDYEKEKDNPFLNRIKNEKIACLYTEDGSKSDMYNPIGYWIDGKEIYEDMKQYGRRNISLLTTAPTGTISNLTYIVDRIYGSSSGIEPVFRLSYTRRKKINPSDEGSRVDFVDDSGNSWQEFDVYHPTANYWMQVTGETDITKSPWYGYCAEEIDWKQRVRLQAAAQRHIDHSISSTLNLPADATEEQVAEVYETAWKAGCKGITVYREGCRDGVLVDKTKKYDKMSREKVLPCDVYHITVKGTQYFVLVGTFEGQPYEVFAGRNGIISKKAKHGTITKVKKGDYKFEADTGEVLESITEYIEDDEEAITRLTSLLLRKGTPINEVVEQLEKTKGSLAAFSKSIIRAVKKYIPDNTKSTELCQECKAELVFIEGCKQCKSCGWSKC